VSTALAHRAFDVLRGDADAIRLIGSDPRATDQSLPLMFFAVLVATVRVSVQDPVAWAIDAFIVAAVGLLFYSVSMWLIGKAFDGTGRFISLFRLAGFTAVPLALGLVSSIGLVVGAVWSFALASRVVWALHVEELQIAIVTAVLPSMLVIAMVFAVAVDVAG
jgi:hypothetical protein